LDLNDIENGVIGMTADEGNGIIEDGEYVLTYFAPDLDAALALYDSLYMN